MNPDLIKEHLGPVTIWFAQTKVGLDFLNDACKASEAASDYFQVESRRNHEIENAAKAKGLIIGDA